MSPIGKAQAHDEELVLRVDERTLRGLAGRRCARGELCVFVPYTRPDLTRAALAEAFVLTEKLAARIILLAVQVVPYPLPLERPDVAPALLENKLKAIAGEVDAPVEVRLLFARDTPTAIQDTLPADSLVVLATRKRWWPTAEGKLARSLGRAGHSVALLGI
jgi:hypothetical protein